MESRDIKPRLIDCSEGQSYDQRNALLQNSLALMATDVRAEADAQAEQERLESCAPEGMTRYEPSGEADFTRPLGVSPPFPRARWTARNIQTYVRDAETGRGRWVDATRHERQALCEALAQVRALEAQLRDAEAELAEQRQVVADFVADAQFIAEHVDRVTRHDDGSVAITYTVGAVTSCAMAPDFWQALDAARGA